MRPFRPDAFQPVPRRTILHDTQQFTEEPVSFPHSPTQTIHFLTGPRLPGSRRTTEPVALLPREAASATTPPFPYPQYINGANEMNDVPHKWTQDDQDQYDEKVRKKAMSELVQSWMDRLQLISVITTFFAAIEAQLLGITTPDSRDSDSPLDQVANAALAGALVVHVFAAIMSFFAAFFLIRYKLSMAKREERKAVGHVHPRPPPPTQLGPNTAPQAQPLGPNESVQTMRSAETTSSSSVWSSNPHLEQVGPFRRGRPPTHLLDHCHSLCMWLSAIGFVLALVGVMCFAWVRLAGSAGVFASVCMGACLVAGVGAIFWPASAIHRRQKTA